MGIKAILSTLPYKLNTETERELWMNYMARCSRIISENTANMVQGSFISLDYEDIIHKKPQVKQKPGDVSKKIKAKLR